MNSIYFVLSGETKARSHMNSAFTKNNSEDHHEWNRGKKEQGVLSSKASRLADSKHQLWSVVPSKHFCQYHSIMND